jgi:hypothetical protein
LLEHVHEDIFAHPTFEYVNQDLVRIAKLWAQDILEERRVEEEMRALEEEAEMEKQRQIEETTASLVASLRSKSSKGKDDSGSTASISTAKGDQKLTEEAQKALEAGPSDEISVQQSTVSKISDEQSQSIAASATGPPADDAGPSTELLAESEAEPEAEPEPESVPEPREEIEWFDREELLETFPRVEQMHVNVLGLFLTDKPRYYRTVVEYVNKYAILIPPEPEPEPEPVEEVADPVYVVETMGDDYYYDPNEVDPDEQQLEVGEDNQENNGNFGGLSEPATIPGEEESIATELHEISHVEQLTVTEELVPVESIADESIY